MKTKISDVARLLGVSKETIRRDLKALGDKIKDHVEKTPKGFILDDTAIDLLRKKREAISVVDYSGDLQIKELQEENRRLYQKLIEANEKLYQLRQDRDEINTKLITAQATIEQNARLISMKDDELNQFQPFVFGLYKKSRKK